MYEKPKKTKRKHLRNTPAPSECCDVDGCNRKTVVYFKEHDVSRCASCCQRDLDDAGKSANPLTAKVMIGDDFGIY